MIRTSILGLLLLALIGAVIWLLGSDDARRPEQRRMTSRDATPERSADPELVTRPPEPEVQDAPVEAAPVEDGPVDERPRASIHVTFDDPLPSSMWAGLELVVLDEESGRRRRVPVAGPTTVVTDLIAGNSYEVDVAGPATVAMTVMSDVVVAPGRLDLGVVLVGFAHLDTNGDHDGLAVGLPAERPARAIRLEVRGGSAWLPLEQMAADRRELFLWGDGWSSARAIEVWDEPERQTIAVPVVPAPTHEVRLAGEHEVRGVSLVRHGIPTPLREAPESRQDLARADVDLLHERILVAGVPLPSQLVVHYRSGHVALQLTAGEPPTAQLGPLIERPSPHQRRVLEWAERFGEDHTVTADQEVLPGVWLPVWRLRLRPLPLRLFRGSPFRLEVPEAATALRLALRDANDVVVASLPLLGDG